MAAWPDAIASSPPNMISLLDQSNNMTEIRAVEGLQKLLRVIYKANVCGKENGIVFVRHGYPYAKRYIVFGSCRADPRKE